jgi:hypothetical protein
VSAGTTFLYDSRTPSSRSANLPQRNLSSPSIQGNPPESLLPYRSSNPRPFASKCLPTPRCRAPRISEWQHRNQPPAAPLSWVRVFKTPHLGVTDTASSPSAISPPTPPPNWVRIFKTPHPGNQPRPPGQAQPACQRPDQIGFEFSKRRTRGVTNRPPGQAQPANAHPPNWVRMFKTPHPRGKPTPPPGQSQRTRLRPPTKLGSNVQKRRTGGTNPASRPIAANPPTPTHQIGFECSKTPHPGVTNPGSQPAQPARQRREASCRCAIPNGSACHRACRFAPGPATMRELNI